MKKLNMFSVMATLAVAFTIGLIDKSTALAATTPTLGAANSFGILSSTYTNTVAGTTINGDLGFVTGPAVTPTVNGTTHPADGTFAQAGIDQGVALSALASQACTTTFAPGAIDLAADTTHGPIGIYTPGVYCSTGATSIGTAGITLSGSGTYIFRINGALTTVVNSAVRLANGASSCDVFWTPTSATTLGANSTFIGNDIDASGITIGSTVTWAGKALAFGGTVTTDTDTINASTCLVVATPVVPVTPVTPVAPISATPSIKVEKSASDETLRSGPKKVTFKYKVTNEGVVALSDVSLDDNKCDDVDFKGGDVNNDEMLDLTEEWKYECTKKIKKTETNTATAKGHANGVEVKDTDKVTVTVSTPTLPAAGFAPTDQGGSFWSSVLAFFSF